MTPFDSAGVGALGGLDKGMAGECDLWCAAAVEEEGGQRGDKGAGLVEALDLAAAIVPAFAAGVAFRGGDEAVVDELRLVAVEVGDGGAFLLDADGDVAGGVDVEEGPAGAAVGDPAVDEAVELGQVVGVGEEVWVARRMASSRGETGPSLWA